MIRIGIIAGGGELPLLVGKNLIQNKVRGTIIFSKEGINGTISGTYSNIQKVKRNLKNFSKR